MAKPRRQGGKSAGRERRPQPPLSPRAGKRELVPSSASDCAWAGTSVAAARPLAYEAAQGTAGERGGTRGAVRQLAPDGHAGKASRRGAVSPLLAARPVDIARPGDVPAMISTRGKAITSSSLGTQTEAPCKDTAVQVFGCRECLSLALLPEDSRDSSCVGCNQVNDLLSLVTELKEEVKRLRSIRECEREIHW